MLSPFEGFFITEEELREHLRTKTSAIRAGVTPYLKVTPYYQPDLNSFLCRFSHSSTLHIGYISQHDMRNYTPIKDFLEKGKQFYVTANGFTFYRVLDLHVDSNRYLEISMQRVTNSLYTEKDHFFMVMPFREANLNTFYHDHVKAFLKKRLGVSIYRADDFNHNEVIIDTIYREIERSEIVVCDITIPNKNVFYEIGYAKAKDKQLIFLMQRGVEHQFFDVAHIQRIEYDFDNPVPMQERLVDTIEHIRKKR